MKSVDRKVAVDLSYCLLKYWINKLLVYLTVIHGSASVFCSGCCRAKGHKGQGTCYITAVISVCLSKISSSSCNLKSAPGRELGPQFTVQIIQSFLCPEACRQIVRNDACFRKIGYMEDDHRGRAARARMPLVTGLIEALRDSHLCPSSPRPDLKKRKKSSFVHCSPLSIWSSSTALYKHNRPIP